MITAEAKARYAAQRQARYYRLRPFMAEQKRKYYLRKGKQTKIANDLKVKFGLSLADYSEKLARQQGCCAICGILASGLKRRLAVDHDHKTGKVRGLLCSVCNCKIVFAAESGLLESAYRYLKEHA